MQLTCQQRRLHLHNALRWVKGAWIEYSSLTNHRNDKQQQAREIRHGKTSKPYQVFLETYEGITDWFQAQ